MTALEGDARTRRVEGGEVALWAVVVVVAQWFTLLGLPLALVLAFTRLRPASARVRWGLVVLAGVVLVVQVVGMLVGGASALDLGPAAPVG